MPECTLFDTHPVLANVILLAMVSVILLAIGVMVIRFRGFSEDEFE